MRYPGLVPSVSAFDALFRNSEDFLPDSLSLCQEFWEDVVLLDHPLKVDILLCLKHGIKIEYFLSEFSLGIYSGGNHVALEFQKWVTLEIQQLVKCEVLLK